jgi:hypothetical protein
LEIVREINRELSVWNPRRIDEKTIEHIQVRRVTLRAVYCRFRACRETSLDEVLHLSGVGKGEGRI